MPANFGMLVVTPIAVLAGVISLVAFSFVDPLSSVYIWFSFAAIVLLAFAISKNLLTNFFELWFSLLKALYEISFTQKKHDQIVSIKSTRR